MSLTELLSDVSPVTAAATTYNSREMDFIDSPNKRIIFSIISRYILSPVVSKTVFNLLDSLENGQSITLTDLLINVPSKIRPDKTSREQLIQDLSDSNLFSIRRPRKNSFVISKTSHYV